MDELTKTHLFLYVLLVLFMAIIQSSCGTVEPGDTERAVDCIDGCSSEKDLTGPPGKDGLRGPVGPEGPAGTGCTVMQASNGAVINCAGGTSAVVLNGEDGADGVDGEDGADAAPTAYTFTEVIDPCGQESTFDEVLFRMHNGDLIALYYDKKKKESFLTTIGPGNYITTDGTGCSFSVGTDMSVTW